MSSYRHAGLERLERRLGPRTRGRAAATALGAVLGLGGVALGVVLHSLTSGASYAQLVGAVALAMLLGGVPAGVAATVVGWGLGAFVLEDSRWQSVFDDRDALLRWSTSLLAAAVVVAVGWAMRRGHERAAVAAVEAERSRRRLEAIQELTASLSAAVRPADVAGALAGGVVDVLGAQHGAFGLVEGDELIVVESGSEIPRDHATGTSTPLSARTPLAAAAREGHVVWVERHAELARAFPDAAARGAASVLAVPVRRGGSVIGAMAFAFREPAAVTLERRAVAALAAELGGQALERARLYELERLEAERTGRLQALTAALAESLVPADVAAIVREQGIGTAGADAVAVHLVSEGGESLELEGASGVDAAGLTHLARLSLGRDGAVETAFSRGRASFHPSLATLRPDDALRASLEAEGLVSAALFPLGASRRVHGVLLLGWRTAQALEPEDRAFAGTFASQCGQALDRAIRYESERTIAETLQQSVLPQALPDVDGVTFAARYLPGEAGVDVGGDWYDAFALPDGRIALVVGDVVGKGVQAAATMGQLRNSLRAFASEHDDPGEVVRRLSRMVDALPDAPFATLAYLVLDVSGRHCSYVVAGHPPPLVVDASGTAAYLEGGRSLPLGVDGDAQVEVAEAALETGTTIVLYTDGLVERRDASLDEGFELVRETAGSVIAGPDTLIDHILRGAFGDAEREDDVAMLVVRLEPLGTEALHLRLPADDEGLRRMRATLGEWLGELGARPDVRHDLLLAAWEACANAVEHAQGPSAATFSLHADHEDEVVRIRIADTGRWRVPGTFPSAAERGLGLPLMRGLMDRVDIVHAADGTVVVLERRLEGRDGGPASTTGVFADSGQGRTESWKPR
jgi:serine phosphatase RsbU (regulator of sigma subunit)/anti-sigma regulatory factor (Ser/Thr protein kinase)